MRVLKWGGIGARRRDRAAGGGPAHPARAAKRRAPAAVVAAANVPRARARRGGDREADARCAARGNFGADGYRPFYFALTEIVRDYLGARYGFDSLEMTTTELLDELQARAPSTWSARPSEVPRFFARCDLVKFAKAGSTDAAALAALDAAQAIVLSTAAPLEQAAQSISGPVRLPRPPEEDAGG